MPEPVYILTDNTAQFLEPRFKGHHLVTMLPQEHNKSYLSHQSAMRPGGAFSRNGWGRAASILDFEQSFLHLRHNTHDVLVLTAPQSLGLAFDNARQAVAKMNGNLNIKLINSFTTAAGLGWLVQLAARLALEGMHLSELERTIRFAVSNIYTLLCVPDVSYLANIGYLTVEQARVSEMLNLMPIFTLDDGQLSPLSKARTTRHILEIFQEFVSEFENPQYVIYIAPRSSKFQFRTRGFRDFVTHTFPNISFAEMPINPPLAAHIGPQSSGIIVVENLEKFP